MWLQPIFVRVAADSSFLRAHYCDSDTRLAASVFMLRLMVEIFMPIGARDQSVRNITVSMAAHGGCTNRLEPAKSERSEVRH